jgi:hypothetical protein
MACKLLSLTASENKTPKSPRARRRRGMKGLRNQEEQSNSLLMDFGQRDI